MNPVLQIDSGYVHAQITLKHDERNTMMMGDIGMNEIFPISDFVRNASEHTARIRRTNRAEILTQNGRPSLAVLPAEEFERLMEAKDYLDTVEAIRIGLQAADAGQFRTAEDIIQDWEAL